MANPEQNRSSSALPWIAVAVLAVVAVFAVRISTRPRVEVRVSPVTYQTISSTVSTSGKVEPVVEFQAHSPAAGVIQKIFVEVGQHVSPGTPLIEMDPSDARKQVAAAMANLSSAELALNDLNAGGSLEERTRFGSDVSTARAEQQQAASSLSIEQRLQQKGSASIGEVAAAQQRLDTANASLKTATTRSTVRYSSGDRASTEARVADARAGLAAAQSGLASISQHSPISGTVYSIPVSTYDFVPAGDDLLDVADLNRIQIRAYFDEPEIGKLARGQAVRIVWDAKPLATWHGHIERAPTTVITYGTRNVGECIITVDDAKGDLLPNTNVTVTVTESQRNNVLSVPREALHTEGAASFVYRIINRRLVRTPVQVGALNLVSVEITSGLSGKDVVVLGPTQSGIDLSNGLEVKPVA